jgi:hypothetical protein
VYIVTYSIKRMTGSCPSLYCTTTEERSGDNDQTSTFVQPLKGKQKRKWDWWTGPGDDGLIERKENI